MSIDLRHLELLHLIRFDDGELSDNPSERYNPSAEFEWEDCLHLSDEI